MNKHLMRCGHVANGKDNKGNPVCCICIGITNKAKIIEEKVPDLSGRKAFCAECHKCECSSYNLPFFEYCGDGSFKSKLCKNCGYSKEAHQRESNKCFCYEPKGDNGEDSYYCGCLGWG